MGQPHHHDLGLWGGKCHIFPKLRKRPIWCEYFSITRGSIIQGHTINIIYQNKTCNGQGGCVHSLGS